MDRNLVRHLVYSIVFISLAACNDSGTGVRQCLGSPDACSAGNIPQESQVTPPLSCTATAFPSQVVPGQLVRVEVDTIGGVGNKSIPGYVASFASSVSLQGQYNPDKAGTTVTRTVDVVDSQGNGTSCSFSVQVLDGTTQNGFACQVAASPPAPALNTPVTLTFTALNAPGAVSFSDLEANIHWSIPDQNIVPLSATSAQAQVQYTVAGTKVASIRATSGSSEVFCRASFTVGNSSSGSLAGCNVETAPLGYGADGSQASLAGSVTRIRAVPSGGTGPYTLSVQSANGGQILGAAVQGPGPEPEVHVRFATPGAKPVSVQLTDSTGATASCQTTHISLPNDALIVGAGPDIASSTQSRVEVYRNSPPVLSTQFSAFEGNSIGGVRVASADFDGDGMNDVLVAAGTGGESRLRVFSASALSSSNSAPTSLIDTTAGFGTDDVVVGAGDVNGDGHADLVVAPGCSSLGTQIKVLSGVDATQVLAQFQPFAGNSPGIAALAVADTDADGYADIIASPCYSGMVEAFSGRSVATNQVANHPNQTPFVLLQFFAFSNYSGQLTLSAGDIDGDARAEVFVGGDAACLSSGSVIRIFSGWNGALLREISAGAIGHPELASADINGDGYAEVIYSSSILNQGPVIQVIDGQSLLRGLLSQQTVNPFTGFLGMVYLAAGGG